MTNALRDALNPPDLLEVGAVSGLDLASGACGPHAYATASVENAALANNAVSGIKIHTAFPVAGTGSPTVYGLSVQTGSSATGAGSDAWVVFGAAFGKMPFVTLTNTSNVGGMFISGLPTAGSFYVQSVTASSNFAWTAIGSTGAGRI